MHQNKSLDSLTDKSPGSVCYLLDGCRDCKQALFDNITNGDFGMGDLVYKLFKYTIMYVRHKNENVMYMLNEEKTAWSYCPKSEVYNIIMMRISSDLKNLYEGLLKVEDPKNMEAHKKRWRHEDIETQKKMIMSMYERVKTPEGMSSIMKYAIVKFSGGNNWKKPATYLGTDEAQED